MDPLTGLLDGPQASGAFVMRMVMEPPWGIRVEDRAPLTVAAVIDGEAWVTPAGGSPSRLRRGQIGLLCGPDPYRFGDRPEAPVQVVVHPGQRCEDPNGRSMVEPFLRGVRTWGNSHDGGTVVVIGTYEHLSERGRRILHDLPPLVIVDRDDTGTRWVDLIDAELVRDVPGQGVVLDRLLDLLTVSALRAWFDSSGASAPAWWQAADDPIAGPALRLLQHNPAHPWTVALLASNVGVSRASLARRFCAVVGQPPMAFLTEWRLMLAAELLLEPGATVQAVASQVGYGTGFALSAAFKRERGISPSEHRKTQTHPFG
ncbi:MAG TPA: AraC family transcriptional regulator [Ilumatobacteraceae bacterium]|nr:AraC family transcriptional regulator [Ilumatobacteraceae bacterium]